MRTQRQKLTNCPRERLQSWRIHIVLVVINYPGGISLIPGVLDTTNESGANR